MKELMKTLYVLLGNKRYLHDLEKILEKLDLTPAERQTMEHLRNDLRNLQNELSQAKQKAKQPWRNF